MAVSCLAGSFNVGAGSVGSTIDVTGSITISGASAVILFFNGRTENTDAAGRRSRWRGVGFAVSSTDRRCQVSQDQDAAAAHTGGSYHSDAACIASMTIGTDPDGLIDFDSWLSNGFRLIVDDEMPVDFRVGYIIITGLDNAATGQWQDSSSTGNVTPTTALSFQPDVEVLMASVIDTTPPGGRNGNQMLGLGFAVSTSEQATWTGGSDQGSGTTDTDSYCNDAECLSAITAGGGSTLATQFTFVSHNSNGFTLNQSLVPATITWNHFLAMKGGNFKVVNVSTQTDTTTDIVTPALGFTPVGVILLSAFKAEHTVGTPTVHDTFSMGVASSPTNRFAAATWSEDGLADTEVYTAIEHDEVYVSISSAPAVEGLMDVKSFDTNTITFIMDDADPSAKFVPMLVIGNAGAATQTITLTSGIASAEAFGSPVVEGGLKTIAPTGIASGEAFGTTTVIGSAQLSQKNFRFRIDDSQILNADAGWAAALNVSPASVDAGKRFRVRTEVENTTASAVNDFYTLQYRFKPSGGSFGSWADISYRTMLSDISAPIYVVDSAQYTNGAATTDLLSGSSQTFVAGTGGASSNVTGTVNLASNRHTEFEWVLMLSAVWGNATTPRSVNKLANGDQIELRLVRNASTVLDAYSNTPLITANIPDYLIGGNFPETPNHAGPFKDSNGNLYVFIEAASQGGGVNVLTALKSTDGGKQWSIVDNGNGPAEADIEGFDVYHDVTNHVFHIVIQDGSSGADITYHRLNDSGHATPDDWAEIDTMVHDNNNALDQCTSIVLLSNGDLMLTYNSGTADVVYRRKISGTWETVSTEIDTTAVNFYAPLAVRGESDKVHIFYRDGTNNDIYHKSWTSGGGLSARELVDNNNGSGDTQGSGGIVPVYWDDGGAEKIMGFTWDLTTNLLYSVLITDDGTPASRVAASGSIQVMEDPGSSGITQPIATAYVDPITNIVWLLFTGEDGTLYRNSYNGTWGTPVSLLDDPYDIDFVKGTIFTHSSGNGGDRVFGYMYAKKSNGDPGYLWYGEYVIAAAGSTQEIDPTGIASAEAFGTARLDLNLSLIGIASVEAFGGPTFNRGAVSVVPTGIPTEEAHGTSTITTGPVTVDPTGIASAETFGTLAVNRGAVSILPSGISGEEAFGTARLDLNVVAAGIPSAEALGTPVLSVGAITVSPSGILSEEAFGTPTILVEGAAVYPSGIESSEAFGTATLNRGAVSVQPSGISSEEVLGTPSLIVGTVTIEPTGISSDEAFGNSSFTPGSVTVTITGIPTAEAFGAPSIVPGTITIAPSGILSDEAFGNSTILPGPTTVTVSGISSAEAFGITVLDAPQYVIPDSDISRVGWVNESDSTTNLYQSVDDIITNDADYVKINPTGVAQAVSFGMTNPTDPETSSGHIVSYRIRQDGSANNQLTVRLKQGDTTIASWVETAIPADWTTINRELTALQADSITDYTDVRIELEAVVV